MDIGASMKGGEVSATTSSSHTGDSPEHHPYTVQLQGRSLLVPRTSFSRAVVMGNEASLEQKRTNDNNDKEMKQSTVTAEEGRPLSNLSVLMKQQEQQKGNAAATTKTPASPPQTVDEADSASGGPTCVPRPHLGSSAPMTTASNTTLVPAAPAPLALHRHMSMGTIRSRRYERSLYFCMLSLV